MRIIFILGLGFIFIILVTMALSQEIMPTPRDSKLGFSPREHLQRLAEAKAQRLDNRREYERLYLSDMATNWQEYDICYYDIDWRLNDTTMTIHGAVGIYGHPTVAQLDSVMVNLDDALVIDSVYDDSGPLTFSHFDHHINIHLRTAHNPADQFGFTIVYHGQPVPAPDGQPGLFIGTRNDAFYVYNSSEPYHSRQWWPCNDITVDKSDSVDVRITIDTSVTAASNGMLMSDIDHGDATHTMHWKHRYPISPYLVCLGIYNYSVWEDYYHYSPTDSMPIYNYVFPGLYAESFDTLSVTPYTLGLFADLFGEYPFINERYGHTYSDIMGMEYQTNSFIGPNTQQETIVHEIAHQWWGDMVTCSDWANIWINEGFATYCEGLYYESIGGPDWYHDYMHDISYIQYPYGNSIYVTDTTETWSIFDWRVFAKGAWVLHMLRHIVGDSVFFQILNHYRADYEWTVASTEDFQAVCETVSGLDLSTFFQQWIYGTCQPEYRHSFDAEEHPGGGWNIYFHLRQIHPSAPQVFIMPLDVMVTPYSGDTTVFVVSNDQREQDFYLHVDNEPRNVYLDPDNWVLKLSSWEQYGLRILNDDLADGVQGEPYLDSVIAKGGFTGHDIVHVVIGGELPAGLELDEWTGIISGTTYDSGDFAFTVEATDEIFPASYADTMIYEIYFAPTAPRPGDANVDGGVDVGDAVYVINYIFKNGSAPLLPNWADVNADCAVNVGDAVYLITFIFKSGPAPLLGCVN